MAGLPPSPRLAKPSRLFPAYAFTPRATDALEIQAVDTFPMTRVRLRVPDSSTASAPA